MKFKIATWVLKQWLSIVNHATAWVSTTPILDNILIKVNFKNIVLTSNNLEMAIEYTIDEKVSIKSEGAFSVPSKLFSSYIWLLSDDEIDIELVSWDSLQIKTDSWNTKIKWIEASEFPVIPSIKSDINFTLKWRIFKRSIEKTLFSSAEWNIRPTLAGIFVNIKWQEAIFASTDSFRLSEYKAYTDTPANLSFTQIIPSKTTYQIKSILDDKEDVKIVSWDSQIAFLFWNCKIYSRILNGKFPDYYSFFPNSYSTKAIINRVDLMQALKKINLISKENNYSIKMSLSSDVWILLETSETQIWEWEVRLVGSVEWEDNIIWVNSVYFLEVLGVMDSSHISISFENPLAPILILPEDADNKKKEDNDQFRHIIMPLKI